jgi:hypothetical protein
LSKAGLISPLCRTENILKGGGTSVNNGNYVYSDGHIALIRERLRIIEDTLFDRGASLKRHSEETTLLEAMAYLEKENDRLPLYFRKQIDFVLSEARYILSNK